MEARAPAGGPQRQRAVGAHLLLRLAVKVQGRG